MELIVHPTAERATRTATSPSPDATRGPRGTSVSSLRPALAGTQPTVVSTEPWLPPLSRAYKAINLVGIVLPLAGLVIAILLLCNRMVGLTEIGILLVGYLITGVGITVGLHRLFM